MLCPDEGLLRAYVDRELPARQADEVARHVAGCVDCRARLAEIEKAAGLVRSRLALLAPGQTDRPAEPALALAAVRRRAERRPTLGERLREQLAGLGAALSPARVAAAAVPVALAAALLLTPAGSAAQSMLGVFRVQQVAAVQVDPAMLPSMPEPEDLGTFNMPSQPKLKTATLAEAGKAAGLTPRTVRQLPKDFAAQPLVMVSDPAEGSFTYDLKKLEAYYQQRGIAGKPPAELGGLTIKGSMPPAVLAVYADQSALAEFQNAAQATLPRDANGKPAPGSLKPGEAGMQSTRFLAFGQAHSPQIEVPDNVDVAKLRQEELKSGVLPPELNAQLAAIQDWQHTLPVPVLKGTSRDVTVDGVHGVLVSEQGGLALIWQKGGVVYGLFGNVTEAELMAAANSIQ